MLLITHHVERLMVADAIWYMENGRLLQVGSARELVRSNGHTASLFQSTSPPLTSRFL